MLRKWFTVVFLLSTLLNVSSEERESAVFLARCGFHQEISLYPQLLSQYIPMDPNMAVALNFGPHQQAVQSIIDEHIAGVDYVAYVQQRFDEVYDEGKAADFGRWMESELGAKILGIEEDLNDPDTVHAVMDYQGFPGWVHPSRGAGVVFHGWNHRRHVRHHGALRLP